MKHASVDVRRVEMKGGSAAATGDLTDVSISLLIQRALFSVENFRP